MKIVIFAGGTGRRLWPISRQKSPKQFEPILGDKSTLRLAVDRILDPYGAENIFISTNERYADIVRRQLPELPPAHVIGEPERRDLAAAVGLAMAHIVQTTDAGPDEPVAILWGDNTMENVDNFHRVLATAEDLLQQNIADILFVGEKPRFPNDNLGWLALGEQLGTDNNIPYYRFGELAYRPPLEKCRKWFEAGTHVWNTGYFITTPGFVQSMYAEHQSEIARQLGEIQSAIGTEQYEQTLHDVYPEIKSISFDDAVLIHIEPEQAAVLSGEMGWSDPGTLYALKESINPDATANVTKGLVIDKNSEDCLVYNYEEGKLVAAIGLEGMIVVNMDDVVLVVHKDQIPLVKQVVNDLEGTELESFS